VPQGLPFSCYGPPPPPSPTISAPIVSGLTVPGTTTASGTFANGAPSGLTQVLDGVTTTVGSPTITTTSGSGATAVGTYSFTFATPAAGGHTVSTNGTGTYVSTGPATGFSTANGTVSLVSPPTIGGYNGVNAQSTFANFNTMLDGTIAMGMDFIAFGTWPAFVTDFLYLINGGSLPANGWKSSPVQLCLGVPLGVFGMTILQMAGGAAGICLSQSVAGAGALTLNGLICTAGTANLDTPGSHIAVASTANDASVVFTVTGTNTLGATFSYTATGANANTVYTPNNIIAPAQARLSAGNLTLSGALVTSSVATFVTPSQISIATSSSADHLVVFTVTGTNALGSTITQTCTGANGATLATTPTTVNNTFLTVTNIAASGTCIGTITATAPGNNFLTVTGITSSAACAGQIMIGPAITTTSPTYVQGINSTTDAMFTFVATTLVENGLSNAILRIAWEQNVPGQSPWYITNTGRNTLAAYAAAWDRIAVLMKAVPGNTFKTFWCPAAGGLTTGNIELSYPTNANVDYIGIDSYYKCFFIANTTKALVWTNETFGAYPTIGANQYGFSLKWLAAFAAIKGKPIALGEWATGWDGVTPAQFAGGHGMGDSAYYVNQIFAYCATNSVAFCAGWWDATTGGFDGQCSLAQNVTGVAPVDTRGNKWNVAQALRANWAPTAPALANAPTNVNPGVPIVTWASGFAGGVIPPGTPYWIGGVQANGRTVLGQLTPTNGASYNNVYTNWSDNHGVMTVDDFTGTIYVYTNPSVPSSFTTPYTATFSVMNDTDPRQFTTATISP
jgi:hypothetical protein